MTCTAYYQEETDYAYSSLWALVYSDNPERLWITPPPFTRRFRKLLQHGWVVE